MTSEDRKEALRYLPKFWQSLVQAIVQSRSGEKTCSFSKSPKKGSSMFNIEINANEHIVLKVIEDIKSFFGNQTLTPDNPFSLEISLYTSEKARIVIEIWTLSVEENYDSSPVNICQITDRMTILLKSVMCVSRTVPAYKYALKWSPSSHVFMYSGATGKPSLSSLGADHVQVRIGQTNIQCGFLNVHLAYRTNFEINTQPRVFHEQIMVKSDHFKIDSSPKRYRKTSERVSESSETVPTSDDSQDRFPFISMEMQHSSPRSRTSSESSFKGTFPPMSEKIFVPFATKKPAPVDDHFLHEQSPSAQFLASAIEKLELEELEYQREEQEKKKRLKVRKISETDCESKVTKEIKGSIKTTMNTSGQSNKSLASNTTRDDEFVLLDMKTPFVETSSSDISACFREWHSAPPLKSFSDNIFDDEDYASTRTSFLKEELKAFESHVEEFDELVKSFHTEDLRNSHEEIG